VLVLPAFTVSIEGPRYTPLQLAFVGVSSFTVWCSFVFFQTVDHRDYFLPLQGAPDESVHAEPPTTARALASFGMLLVALVAVVGLAKVLSPAIESAVRRAGWPPAVVGIAIALLVLTLLVCTIGVGTGGRTSMMLGVVQLVIFAAFVFLAIVP
jgi:Ca2+:H+ antiporter